MGVDARLWLLLAVAMLESLSGYMGVPFVPLYAASLGASPYVIGAILSVFGLMPLFLAVPMGSLSDRFGHRRMIILGASCTLLSRVCIVLWPTLLGLAFGQVVAGLGDTLLAVSGQAYVGVLRPKERRAAYMGYYTSAISAGQMVAPAVGGWLVDSRGYPFSFTVSGLVAVVLVITACFLPDTRQPGAAERGLIADLREAARLTGNRTVRVGLAASFVGIFSFGVREAFFPLFLGMLGFSATGIGFFVSLRAAATMTTRPLLGLLARVVGTSPLLFLSLAGASLVIGLTPLLPWSLAIAVTTVLFGIAQGISQPLTIVMVLDAVPRAERGLAAGVRLMGTRLAKTAHPMVFGATMALVGIKAAFWLSGGLLAVFCIWLLPALRRLAQPGDRVDLRRSR